MSHLPINCFANYEDYASEVTNPEIEEPEVCITDCPKCKSKNTFYTGGLHKIERYRCLACGIDFNIYVGAKHD